MKTDDVATEDDSVERLSSEELAAHIVDALLQAGIVNEANVQRSITIAAEEIEARKVMGDY